VNLVQAGETGPRRWSHCWNKGCNLQGKNRRREEEGEESPLYPAAASSLGRRHHHPLIFVIPQFESLFKGFGADLPAFTRW